MCLYSTLALATEWQGQNNPDGCSKRYTMQRHQTDTENTQMLCPPAPERECTVEAFSAVAAVMCSVMHDGAAHRVHF
jgi:hypothetical protein